MLAKKKIILIGVLVAGISVMLLSIYALKANFGEGRAVESVKTESKVPMADKSSAAKKEKNENGSQEGQSENVELDENQNQGSAEMAKKNSREKKDDKGSKSEAPESESELASDYEEDDNESESVSEGESDHSVFEEESKPGIPDIPITSIKSKSALKKSNRFSSADLNEESNELFNVEARQYKSMKSVPKRKVSETNETFTFSQRSDFDGPTSEKTRMTGNIGNDEVPLADDDECDSDQPCNSSVFEGSKDGESESCDSSVSESKSKNQSQSRDTEPVPQPTSSTRLSILKQMEDWNLLYYYFDPEGPVYFYKVEFDQAGKLIVFTDEEAGNGSKVTPSRNSKQVESEIFDAIYKFSRQLRDTDRKLGVGVVADGIHPKLHHKLSGKLRRRMRVTAGGRDSDRENTLIDTLDGFVKEHRSRFGEIHYIFVAFNTMYEWKDKDKNGMDVIDLIEEERKQEVINDKGIEQKPRLFTYRQSKKSVDALEILNQPVPFSEPIKQFRSDLLFSEGVKDEVFVSSMHTIQVTPKLIKTSSAPLFDRFKLGNPHQMTTKSGQSKGASEIKSKIPLSSGTSLLKRLHSSIPSSPQVIQEADESELEAKSESEEQSQSITALMPRRQLSPATQLHLRNTFQLYGLIMMLITIFNLIFK